MSRKRVCADFSRQRAPSRAPQDKMVTQRGTPSTFTVRGWPRGPACFPNAWSVAGSSGRPPRRAKSASALRNFRCFSKVFADTPLGDADESFPEVVQVLDPRHPLFGRSFQVLGRSSFCRVGFPSFYEVAYRDGVTLNVPVAATEPIALPIKPPKLSMEALRDLLNVVDAEHHEHGTRRPLDDAAGDAEAPDRRRHRRGSGGGLS